MPYRTENDVLGKVKIESTAYYGSETQRASENFRISGIRIQSTFIKKYLVLKRSAALANLQCGNLDKKRANAIAMSCDLILSGRLMEQFVVDVSKSWSTDPERAGKVLSIYDAHKDALATGITALTHMLPKAPSSVAS